MNLVAIFFTDDPDESHEPKHKTDSLQDSLYWQRQEWPFKFEWTFPFLSVHRQCTQFQTALAPACSWMVTEVGGKILHKGKKFIPFLFISPAQNLTHELKQCHPQKANFLFCINASSTKGQTCSLISAKLVLIWVSLGSSYCETHQPFILWHSLVCVCVCGRQSMLYECYLCISITITFF